MWLYGELHAAAEVPASSGASDQLIIVVGTVIVAAITTLGGVVIAVYNSRSGKTTPSPPSPVPAGSDHVLYERTAVLGNRADDSDERFEILDRRVDQIERVLDIDNPHWRGRR